MARVAGLASAGGNDDVAVAAPTFDAILEYRSPDGAWALMGGGLLSARFGELAFNGPAAIDLRLGGGGLEVRV